MIRLGKMHFNPNRVEWALVVLVAFLAGCGSQQGLPPPSGDFTLSVSPDSVSVVVGNTTPSVTIAVNPEDGFSGTVSIALQGVPAHVTPTPSASFSLAAGASQSVTFSVSDSASVGPSSVTIVATSGKLSHSAQLSLTDEAIVRTYQVGSVLYLESGTATDTARVGLETAWGGSIVEVSVNGTEFVNRHDTGREIQVSYRDGGNLSYNPTLGGDDLDQGTPTISYVIGSDSLYTKSQPLQWYAERYGGSLGQPVAGDVLVEQTVTAVTGELHTFKVHIKATHLGSDLHTTTGQEFPAVYTTRDYGNFVYYAGKTPWTNAATISTQFPTLGQANPPVFPLERWGALVNTQNQGVAVDAPSVDPLFIGFIAPDVGGGGPTDNYTNYFAALGNLTIEPGFVFEGDFYVIAGDCAQARQTVYRLHQSLTIPDLSSHRTKT